jgi:hypothetical protein
MRVLLQISDTHFDSERPQVVEAPVTLAHRPRPDVVGLSGDTSRSARGRSRSARQRRSSTEWARRSWPFPATTTLRGSTSGPV